MPEETNQTTENTAKELPSRGAGKPFQKGDDPRRNLDGRPAGAKNLTTLVREALKELGAKVDGKEVSYETALVKTILHKAIVQQNPKMIELLWNYLDGKPLQSLNVTADVVMNQLTPDQQAKLDKLLDEDSNDKTQAPTEQSGVKKDDRRDARGAQVSSKP